MTSTTEPVRRLIVWRHAQFGGNVRAKLTGAEALVAVAEGLRHRDYDEWPLLPRGLRQAGLLAGYLRPYDMDLCLSSPTRRTLQTAQIVMQGRGMGITTLDDLRERDRGRFAYAPDEWSERQPDYHVGKENPLTWLPTGGETLLQVMERVKRVLAYANRVAPNMTVGICTHGEVMTTLRALIGGYNTPERLRQPLPPYGKASYTGQVQADFYERRGTGPGMTHFRTLGFSKGQYFQTDWQAISS